MVGGMCGRGACVAGSMHGRGHAWQGACMAGRVCVAGGHAWHTHPHGRYYEILVGGTHPTEMHSCIGMVSWWSSGMTLTQHAREWG